MRATRGAAASSGAVFTSTAKRDPSTLTSCPESVLRDKQLRTAVAALPIEASALGADARRILSFMDALTRAEEQLPLGLV